LIASISGTFTSAVASHGAYAVFGLMAIDAVFPAASELVMLYAGAVAAGVFTSAHHVHLFGAQLNVTYPWIVTAFALGLGYSYKEGIQSQELALPVPGQMES